MLDNTDQFYDEYKEYGLGNITIRKEDALDERKGIEITTNFVVAAQMPLDARTVVQTRQELEYMDKDQIYMGLLVYVIEDNKLYQWKRVLQEDKSEKIEWGPIEAEVSAVEFVDNGEVDLNNIPSLMMQKNKDNFYPITHEKFIYNENGETLFDELKEYQKKELAAEEADKLHTENKSVIGAINELNDKMDKTIEEFETKINKTITDLNQSVADMQAKTAADMEKMKSQLQSDIDAVLAELERKSIEMDEIFQNKIIEINNTIASLQAKIEADIDQMLQDVDNSILSDNQVTNLMDQINANITTIDSK